MPIPEKTLLTKLSSFSTTRWINKYSLESDLVESPGLLWIVHTLPEHWCESFHVLLILCSVTAHASHEQYFTILTELEKICLPSPRVKILINKGYTLSLSYNPFHRRLLEQGGTYPVGLFCTTVSVCGGSQVVLLDPTIHFTYTTYTNNTHSWQPNTTLTRSARGRLWWPPTTTNH